MAATFDTSGSFHKSKQILSDHSLNPWNLSKNLVPVVETHWPSSKGSQSLAKVPVVGTQP